MALVLSLKLGESFMVAGEKVTVDDVVNASEVILSLPGGKTAKATEVEGTEIFPDVFVSAAGFFKWGQVRIAVEAPRRIEILREDRWKSKYGEKEHYGGNARI